MYSTNGAFELKQLLMLSTCWVVSWNRKVFFKAHIGVCIMMKSKIITSNDDSPLSIVLMFLSPLFLPFESSSWFGVWNNNYITRVCIHHHDHSFFLFVILFAPQPPPSTTFGNCLVPWCLKYLEQGLDLSHFQAFGKALKSRCIKWNHILQFKISSASYGQMNSYKSKWQFNS